MNNIDELLATTRDSISARRVYGEPYEKNGITLIPAAAVRGGGGGGGGEPSETTPGGEGAGFGLTARPVGAYQIKGEEVRWIPAADTTRVIMMAEAVAIVALLVIRSIVRARHQSTV